MACKSILTATVMLILLGVAQQAHAQTVRGRVDRVTRGISYPVQGAEVKLYAPGKGYSPPSYTGPDGMFYFYLVAPGQYTLSIRGPWGANRSIDVRVRSGGITDVPPVPLS